MFCIGSLCQQLFQNRFNSVSINGLETNSQLKCGWLPCQPCVQAACFHVIFWRFFWLVETLGLFLVPFSGAFFWCLSLVPFSGDGFWLVSSQAVGAVGAVGM